MESPDQRQAVDAGELVYARNLPPTEGNAVIAVANLPPPGFLAALPHAALDATAVGLLDRAWKQPGGHRQETPRRRARAARWRRRHPRRAVPHRSAPIMHRSAIRWRKRSVSSTMDNLGDDGQKKNESTGVGLSVKRARKRSKYLSPPYTNTTDLDGLDLDEKEEDVGAREVLLLVRGFAKDIFHRRYFPKAAEGFLGMLRSSTFASENTSANVAVVPECPAEDVSTEASADDTVVVYDSSSDSEQKQVEGVFKGSGRKNDPDGSGCSSIKGKEVEKTSPPQKPLGHGLLITPATQVRTEFVISQVKSGVEVDTVTSVQRQTEENIPATIGLLPMHEGVSSQPIDGNEDTVQVQEPNASLQVMVLEEPNVHPSSPALKSRLSIPDMRRGVKHMITGLQNGVKPVRENLLGDLQRLLVNLNKVQSGRSGSVSATP